MKKIFFLTLVLASNLHAQDSIVNYLDSKGKTIKKEQAIEIETIVKKDSLWLITKYYRNGKIKKIGYFNTKDKKRPVGEFVSYHKNGALLSRLFYNLESEKNGLCQSWFNNGKLSASGIYLKNKKEGVWKYYHFNNKEACRTYYKSDSILRTFIFDDRGQQLNTNLIEKNAAKFDGGEKKFQSKIKKLINDITYQIKGTIHVNFVVDVDGLIKQVVIEEDLPKKLNQEIVSYFEAIKGWKPAIHMNRKIPVNLMVPLNFKDN